jgi:outer membrane protein TolC
MVILSLVMTLILAQPDTVRLSELYAATEQNWPAVAQLDRSSQLLELQLQNVRSAWRPSLHLNAFAFYYSEVTQIPFAAPGASPPAQPHDRYAATIDVQQTLWDAGAKREQSSVARAGAQVDYLQTQVDLYALRAQVNEAFFTALLLDFRAASMQMIVEELDQRIEAMQVSVRAGALLATQLDGLKAEQLRARQTLIEIQSLKRASMSTLRLWSGMDLSDQVTLIYDGPSELDGRPEFGLFQAQIDQLTARSRALDVRLRPLVMAVAQGGVGRPGPNLFEDSVTPFYMVGIQFRWQFFNWGITAREQQALRLNTQTIQEHVAVFRRTQAIQDATQRSRFQGIVDQLALDEELVALRTSMAAVSATQLDQGVITVSEYVGYLNAMHQARLDRDIRQLELQKVQSMIQFIQFNRE